MEHSQFGTNLSLSSLSDIETEEPTSEPDVPVSLAEGKRAAKKTRKVWLIVSFTYYETM
jgi:hypothetical protein